MKIKILKLNMGFTLIETLVSLAIFSASIVALINVTSSGVADTNFVKNKLTASYLAQEGVEMVRNIRDTTSLSNPGTGWAQFILSVHDCYSSNGCVIEPITNLLVATPYNSNCNSNGCPLYYDYQTGNGFYTYTPGATASPFTRKITITDIGLSTSTNEINVTSTIGWKQGSSDKFVAYSENLFDWIQ